MAKPDLSSLSLEELTNLIDEATKLRAQKVEAKRQELQRQLAALDEIVTGGEVRPKRARGPKPKMYRAPSGREYANTSEVPKEFRDLGIKDKAGMEPYRIKD